MRFSEEPLCGRLVESMRYSLLAGGKRIRPGARPRDGPRHRRRRARGAAARGRDRAHPHVLAHPRRPPGDGRRPLRRGRPTTTSRSARTPRSSPATPSTPRRSGTPHTPVRRAREHPRRRRRARRGDRRRRDGRRPVPRRRERRREPRGFGSRAAPHARAEDRKADRGVGRVRIADSRHESIDDKPTFATTPRSSASSFRSWTTSST